MFETKLCNFKTLPTEFVRIWVSPQSGLLERAVWNFPAFWSN